jgi:hypothetical protein
MATSGMQLGVAIFAYAHGIERRRILPITDVMQLEPFT